MTSLLFDWRIVAGVLLLLVLSRRNAVTGNASDACECDEYGSKENFAKGGLR